MTEKEKMICGKNYNALDPELCRLKNNAVIGAGSVVTKDIPESVVAVGNPCKVLRPITKKDSILTTEP